MDGQTDTRHAGEVGYMLGQPPADMEDCGPGSMYEADQQDPFGPDEADTMGPGPGAGSRAK